MKRKWFFAESQIGGRKKKARLRRVQKEKVYVDYFWNS